MTSGLGRRWSLFALWAVSSIALNASAETAVGPAGATGAQPSQQQEETAQADAVLEDEGASDAEPNDSSVSRQQRAKDLFFKGLELVAHSDYQGAARAFERSVALRPTLAARFNLANTYVALGRCAAADAESTLLSDRLHDAHEPRWDNEAQALARALVACFGNIALSVRPADAEVLVDDEPVSPGNNARVDPGDHRIEATAPGMQTERRLVHVERGATLRVSITLDPYRGPTSREPASAALPTAKPAEPLVEPSPNRESSRQAIPSWARWVSTSVAAVGGASTAVLWKVTSERYHEYERRTLAFNQRALSADAERDALERERGSLIRLSGDVRDLKTALLGTAVVTTLAATVALWLWSLPEAPADARRPPVAGARF